MTRRIEQLLRLVADMEQFSGSPQEDAGQNEAELDLDELALVAAASAQPVQFPEEAH